MIRLRPSVQRTSNLIGPNSAMIEPLQVYTDDREFFMELTDLARAGSTVVPEGNYQIQIPFMLTYPGTVKGIRHHSQQAISGRLFLQWSRSFSSICVAAQDQRELCRQIPPLGATESTRSWPRLESHGSGACWAPLFHRPPLQSGRRIPDRLQLPRDKVQMSPCRS
jgi:hypothetical protein